MITRIQISGLRGKNFDLQPDKLTMVIGENKAGKTTIADAIRWGLLGYIPGMDKPPKYWDELLSSDAKASVVVDLTDEKLVRSLWLEKGSPKHSHTEECKSVNLLSLDQEIFFAQTGPKQAELIAAASANEIEWKKLVPDKFTTHLDAESWSSWLELSLTSAKQSRLAADQERKMFISTVQGLVTLRGMVLDTADLESQQRMLVEALGNLKSKLRDTESALMAAKGPKRESTAMKKLQAAQRAVQQYIGIERDPQSWADRYDAAVARRNQGRISEGTLSELGAKWQEATSEAATAKAATDTARDQFLTRKKELAKLRKAHQCPTCGTKGESFTKALKALETSELSKLEIAFEAAKAIADVAEDKLSVAVSEYKTVQTAQKEYEAARAAVEEIETERKAIDAWSTHDGYLAEVEAEQQANDQEALEGKKYNIENDIEDAQEQIKELNEQIVEINHVKSQQRQLVEAEEALKNAEARSAELTVTIKELEQLRNKFTVMSLAPILSTLALFTKGIMSAQVELNGTELGRWIGSRWVPLRQFSGAEQCVTRAAMCCALGGKDGRENIVLVDELSIMDDERLHKFLRNVQTAIENGVVISQFIGLSAPRSKKLPAFVKEVRI